MATIVNCKVRASAVRVGDTIIVTNSLPGGRTYSVAAEVRDISRLGKQHLVISYGACDDPSGLGYGSDITVLRSHPFTRLEVI